MCCGLIAQDPAIRQAMQSNHNLHPFPLANGSLSFVGSKLVSLFFNRLNLNFYVQNKNHIDVHLLPRR